MPAKRINTVFKSARVFHAVSIIEDAILYTTAYAKARARLCDKPRESCMRCNRLHEFDTCVSLVCTQECGNVTVCRECADAILLGIDFCDHEWVSVVNKVVKSEEMCPKCNSIRE